MLRRIARSYTEKEAEQAEYDMKKFKMWNSPEYSKLVAYLEIYWFNIKKVINKKNKKNINKKIKKFFDL